MGLINDQVAPSIRTVDLGTPVLAPVLKAEVKQSLGLEECRQTSFLMELVKLSFSSYYRLS